jgi:hypothetical protein
VTATRRFWQRRWEIASPFVAAAACQALEAAGEDPEPFAHYLRQTREADGSWRFDPEGRRWPPDADTTSCAVAALADGSDVLRRIVATQPDPADGLVRPWLLWHEGATERPDRNTSDAVVTANVVYAAQRVGVDASALRSALERHVAAGEIKSVYYDSPFWQDYYFSRAGIARELPLVTSVERLVAEQEADGTWPPARWFTDVAGNTWQSRTFSTAHAVETLACAARG